MTPNRFTRGEFIKLLGLSPLLLSSLPEIFPPSLKPRVQAGASGQPNFLVIVFDTLSARHLSLYGYPRRTTPNLERLAQRATVYHRHYAAANFTSPGTASLLTGVYPWRHQAIHMHSQVAPAYARENIFALPEAYTGYAYTHNPLAYILLHQERELIDALTDIDALCLYSDSAADRWFNRDYSAAYDAELLLQRNGFYPNGSLFFSLIDRLRRHYEQWKLDGRYRDIFPRGVPNYHDEAAPPFLYFTIEQAIDWINLQARTKPQPYLGYIHLLPPHLPHNTRREFNDIFIDNYTPPTKTLHPLSDGLPQSTLNLLRRYYDEAIAYIDAEFARLYDLLEQSGALENTWLIFTSDHGELFERGTYSHITPMLYEPLLHIPLLIWRPGQAQRQDIHTPTSNVDLLPTIFQAAGAPAPGWSAGQVLPGMTEEAHTTSRSVFALEAKESPRQDPWRTATIAILREQYKLIRYNGYPDFETPYELYDVVSDPEELNNLYTPDHPVFLGLRDELESQLSRER